MARWNGCGSPAQCERGLNVARLIETLTEEASMGAKAEALAKQFEAKAQEATGVLEKISDTDWKKLLTSAEKWPICVVAHHLASAHGAIGGIIKAVATGTAKGDMTMDQLNAMNAKHAKDFASCTRAETLALHKKSAAEAAAIVLGLSDDQLTKTGPVLKGMPVMSPEQMVPGVLIRHIDEHLGSIRATIGVR
jgi:hypothetical protein